MRIDSISVYSSKVYRRNQPKNNSPEFRGIKGGLLGGTASFALACGIAGNCAMELKNLLPTIIASTLLGAFFGSKIEDDNDNNESKKRMRRL